MDFGPVHVTLKNTYQRSPGGPIIYQRAIPSDLRSSYPGKTVKHDLKTTDIAEAARAVTAFNKRYEAEWAGLRAAPGSASQSVKAQATAMLIRHGLTPGDMTSDNADVFLSGLQEKLHAFARGDEAIADDAAPAEYLSPVEVVALRMVQGKQRDTLTDALALYLEVHPKKDAPKFVTFQSRAFASLVAVTGDKDIAAFTRADVRAYIAASLLRVKTASVLRNVGVLSAVFATYIKEHGLATPNPFADPVIPRLGHDSIKRMPFTLPELATLEAACRGRDDPPRWILAMLAGTGVRLGEVVGLAMSDLVLDAPFPHVILQVHPWRDIKGANGLPGVKDRMVPLVGVALWAAQRVKAEAAPGAVFAFPRYTTAIANTASTASATLNKWMRSLPLPHTCHELRHTVKDLLRAVQCPQDITEAIQGHGTRSVADGYRLGYDLKVKTEWLTKAVALSSVFLAPT